MQTRFASNLLRGGTERDRRRGVRVARSGRLTIFICKAGGLGDGVRAEFRDASARGIGLWLPDALPPGEQFVVRLTDAGGAPVSMLYTVVRCVRSVGRPYEIGAALAHVTRGDPGGLPDWQREADRGPGAGQGRT